MQKTAAFLKKYRWPLTGALLGALVFVALYGVRVLNPTCVDWILNNASPDPSQHYLGWEFFAASAVRLPYIGANYSAIYPYRTSILFTDSIPLLALLANCSARCCRNIFSILVSGAFVLCPAGRSCPGILARLGGVRPGRRPAAGQRWLGLECWFCSRH